MDDCYFTLGLTRKASIEDIRDAYKIKALLCHPDKPTGSNEAFLKLHTAYKKLINYRTCNSSSVKMTSSNSFSYSARDSNFHASTRDSFRPPPSAATAAPENTMNYSNGKARGPSPLSTVKKPFIALLSGLSNVPYTFEISPEAFRCPLRHGDVVRKPRGKKETGTIVGVGSDGIYWWKSGETFASFFASTSFGKVEYEKIGTNSFASQRQKDEQEAARKKPHFFDPSTHFSSSRKSSSSTFSNSDSASFQGCSSSGGSFSSCPSPYSCHKKKEQATRSETQWMAEFAKIEKEETTKRVEFARALDAYWSQCLWHMRLPLYCPVDRRYNAEGKLSSRAPL